MKGLVDLRTRTAQLAAATTSTDAGDSARLNQELAQIDEYLVEAQRLQLAKDAQLFRRHQFEEYVSAVRQVAAERGEVLT